MKKQILKKICLLILASSMLFGAACGYRGRVIAEDTLSQMDVDAPAPQIISPSREDSAQTVTQTVALYFPYSEDILLGREEREITYSANVRLETAVLDALLAGPSQDYPQLNPIVNDQTQIVNTSVNGNTLFITFNAAFLEPLAELPEDWQEDSELLSTVRTQRRMAVLSIVNSVTGINGINQVQILVDTENDGLGRRIKRQDLGLSPTGDNPDELLETISRQYASNASLQTVSALVLRLMQEKNSQRLYTYVADNYLSEKPGYADWIDSLRMGEWTLESYEVLELIPAQDGAGATVFVNVKYNLGPGQTYELNGVMLKFALESGVWKVDYDSLCGILPA